METDLIDDRENEKTEDTTNLLKQAHNLIENPTDQQCLLEMYEELKNTLTMSNVSNKHKRSISLFNIPIDTDTSPRNTISPRGRGSPRSGRGGRFNLTSRSTSFRSLSEVSITSEGGTKYHRRIKPPSFNGENDNICSKCGKKYDEDSKICYYIQKPSEENIAAIFCTSECERNWLSRQVGAASTPRGDNMTFKRRFSNIN